MYNEKYYTMTNSQRINALNISVNKKNRTKFNNVISINYYYMVVIPFIIKTQRWKDSRWREPLASQRAVLMVYSSPLKNIFFSLAESLSIHIHGCQQSQQLSSPSPGMFFGLHRAIYHVNCSPALEFLVCKRIPRW